MYNTNLKLIFLISIMGNCIHCWSSHEPILKFDPDEIYETNESYYVPYGDSPPTPCGECAKIITENKN